MSVAKTPRGKASLLNRYLLREVGQTWLAVTLVLLLILITNQFAAVLGDAAASQIPRDAIVRVEEVEMDGAEVAIFAYGSVARSAMAVVRKLRAEGVPIGLVRPITLWPFPTQAVERMAEQVRTVIVPEMNIKQMSWEVQAAVAGRAKVVDYGRVDGKLITPDEILELIKPEFYYHRWEDA